MEHLNTSTINKPEAVKCAGKDCENMIEPVKIGDRWFFGKLCPAHVKALQEEDEATERAELNTNRMRRLNLPPRFQATTFENFNTGTQAHAFEFAKRFVENYGKGAESKGLYFWGMAGSGKTHLSAAIGNALVDHEGVRFITVPELLLLIKKTFDKPGIDETFDRLSKTKLLIMDDLGSEKPTEWVQETLFVLIDRRYTHFLPTIFTSNFSLDALQERLGYRLASRIAEMCDVVEMKPVDYRIRKKQ